MGHEGFFKKRLGALHAEGRYRVFADLERCGRIDSILENNRLKAFDKLRQYLMSSQIS